VSDSWFIEQHFFNLVGYRALQIWKLAKNVLNEQPWTGDEE